MTKSQNLLNDTHKSLLSLNDFKVIKNIGRGAFGEVRICRRKETGKIVAIKKMKKEEMIFKN